LIQQQQQQQQQQSRVCIAGRGIELMDLSWLSANISWGRLPCFRLLHRDTPPFLLLFKINTKSG